MSKCQNLKKFQNHEIKKKKLEVQNFILFLKNQNFHKISKRSKIS